MALTVQGLRIKQLRDLRGLDTAQLAKRTNVHVSYIYRLEDGEVPNVSAIIVGKLAQVLDTSVEYLLGMTDNPGRCLQSVSQYARLTERSERIASRIDSLPVERREVVQTMFSRLLDSTEDDESSMGQKKQRLLRFFDNLPNADQDVLLAAAEQSKWTKDTGQDVVDVLGQQSKALR